MALKYFGAVHTYKLITELVARYKTPPPLPILERSSRRRREGYYDRYWNHNVKTGTNRIQCLRHGIPSKIMSGINHLISFITCSKTEGLPQDTGTSIGTVYSIHECRRSAVHRYWAVNASDALSTNAVMFLEVHRQLERLSIYTRTVPMSETTRLHDEGWITTLRHGYDA